MATTLPSLIVRHRRDRSHPSGAIGRLSRFPLLRPRAPVVELCAFQEMPECSGNGLRSTYLLCRASGHGCTVGSDHNPRIEHCQQRGKGPFSRCGKEGRHHFAASDEIPIRSWWCSEQDCTTGLTSGFTCYSVTRCSALRRRRLRTAISSRPIFGSLPRR